MVGIVSNSAALFAQRNLNAANSQSELSIARLSSGNAIIRASDDVSGLAIGTVLRTTVSTLRTVLTSAGQASSLLSIADAALQNIGEILQRQKSLAVQANSGTLSDNERAFLNQEFTNLTTEVDRIVNNTTFNGISLVDGSLRSTSGLETQVPDATGDYYFDGTLGSNVLASGATLAIQTDNGDAGKIIGALSGDNISVGVFFVASNTVDITITIGGVAFTANAIDVDTAADTSVDFTSDDGSVLRIAGNGIKQDFGLGTNATSANDTTIAANLLTDLQDIIAKQEREFSTADGVGIEATTLQGTILEGLDGDDFVYRGSDLDVTNNTSPSISDFVVVAENSVTDGKISVTINGNSYSTVDAAFDGNGADLNAETNLILYLDGDSANANDRFTITLTNTTFTSIDIDTDAGALQLQNALNQAFGAGEAGGLTFQVGTTVTDKIDVSLGSAKTTDIYKDDSDAVVTLSVDTAENAVTASDVLDNAINTVTSLRATVGAYQSRFDFVSAVVGSSIQNQESARSSFLDVDVATESTKFATSQVRLQASISVLAQANQLPQNLLKLIG